MDMQLAMKMDRQADSAIIGAIYDCALDPDGWSEVLDAICRVIDCCSAKLSLIDPWTSSLYIHATAGIEPEWVAAMPAQVEEGVRLFGGASALERYKVGDLVILSRVCDVSAFRASSFYRDWAFPQSVADFMAANLVRDETGLSFIGFGRHSRSGLLDDCAIDRTSVFLPHIRRAVQINGLLEAQRVVSNTLAETFDAMSASVILVDASLRPVLVNPAAQAMLESGWPTLLRGGAIVATDDAAQKRLAQTIKGWSRNGGGGPGTCLRIPTRDVGRCAILNVLSLSGCANRSRIAPMAIAAILVAQPDIGSASRRDDVAALFDLTPTEARVLEHIVAGSSPADAARSLGVQPSTVRTHLLSVFDKTGVHRQNELVALAARVASPLAIKDPAQSPGQIP